MVSALISRMVILVFGTLYPAYSSYKAVKNKNVKEYVKWMMYWIVFALFTTVETFADVLIAWFPFYYELKIAFVVWLLSPATKGSSVLYRKFVHPELLKREVEIDQTLDKVKTQGYSALVNVGQQGFNFAVQSAITGQNKMMDHLMKKSYSMGDISQQQAETRVTYRPVEGVIPERDEPDFRHLNVPSVSQPNLEVNHLQGSMEFEESGLGRQPAVQSSSLNSGYNLRSHEYHGNVSGTNPHKHSYHHSEALEEIICDENVTSEYQDSATSAASYSLESADVLKPKSSLPNKTKKRSSSPSRRHKKIAK